MTKLHNPAENVSPGTSNTSSPEHSPTAGKEPISPVVGQAPKSALRKRKSTKDENYLEQRNKEVARTIQEQLLKEAEKDSSPEAKAARRRILVKAVYGEFMCSLFFYTCVFGFHASAYQNDWEKPLVELTSALVCGFQAIACIFAFSSVSGAQFNPATSTALWVTGKLSNRRAVLYVFVQLLASLMSMVLVSAMFSGDLKGTYEACSVLPTNREAYGKIFATEFILTFLLIYTGFTVAFENAEQQKKDTMSFQNISNSKGLTLFASTPQSKTGFAPFSIGLMLFAIQMCSGTSRGAFNPGRTFGPAIFTQRFEDTYVYWAAEVLGACCAGLMVTNLHRIGYDVTSYRDDTEGKTATEEIRHLEQNTLDENARNITREKVQSRYHSMSTSSSGNTQAFLQHADMRHDGAVEISQSGATESSSSVNPMGGKSSRQAKRRDSDTLNGVNGVNGALNGTLNGMNGGIGILV